MGSVGSAGNLREEGGFELDLIVEWSFGDRVGKRFPEPTLKTDINTHHTHTFC